MKELQCVWWCPKQSNTYNPPHRCTFTRDLVKVKGKLLCRAHKNMFLKTGKVSVKP